MSFRLEDKTPSTYNYVEQKPTMSELPGLSVFVREGDDVFHTYSTYSRGLDILIGAYNYLDLTPIGRNDSSREPLLRLEFDRELGCVVHFHVVASDGVLSRAEDGAATFHAGRAPSRAEIADVAGRVAKQMTKWLRRRKLLDDRPEEERSHEAPEVSEHRKPNPDR